ncbi:hypothetical protein AB0I35_31350 [Nocardia sp. NPDC050378]|uniref:hypothetical protein n=1 Tax=Nocardia sp. NPDC050378 TaxID=3155400 RepID=UPI0033FD5007
MSHSNSLTDLRSAVVLVILAGFVVGCGRGATDQVVASTAAPAPLIPSGVSWRSWQGVELPVAHQGPRQFDGAAVADFDRTPAGAALAAIHATIRMSIAPDGQWARVGERMLAPGPGRDAWAVLRTQISITEPAGATVPTILGCVVGIYTQTEAQIDVYARHSDHSITRNATTVVWADDGWRLPYLRASVGWPPMSCSRSQRTHTTPVFGRARGSRNARCSSRVGSDHEQ